MNKKTLKTYINSFSRLKLNEILFEPKSPVALGLFRIGFGIIMIFQFKGIYPYFFENLVNSNYFIKYEFFYWVELASPSVLKILFNISYLLLVFVILGAFTRVAFAILFFIWTYLFLTDQGHLNNHYYLISIFLFFMSLVNSSEWGSLYKLFKPSKLIPYWNYFVFKFLILVVYFYGGVAKINSDWLVGHPLKGWLHGRWEFGEFIKEALENDFVILAMSYYGLFFDLLVGFMLFHKRLKYVAIIIMIPFHISNHFLWHIGVFPWMSIFMTVLFFEEELSNLFKFNGLNRIAIYSKHKRLTFYFLTIFLTVQLLLPLRQFLYKGPTSWHGYGEYFAWRMMLTDRQGAVRIRLFDQNQTYLGEVSLGDYINYRQIYAMIHQPGKFVPFCKFIEAKILSDERNKNITDVLIYADVFKTINNRPFQRVLDPSVDLTRIEFSPFVRQDFILPFVNKEIKSEFNELSEEELLDFIK